MARELQEQIIRCFCLQVIKSETSVISVPARWSTITPDDFWTADFSHSNESSGIM